MWKGSIRSPWTQALRRRSRPVRIGRTWSTGSRQTSLHSGQRGVSEKLGYNGIQTSSRRTPAFPRTYSRRLRVRVPSAPPQVFRVRALTRPQFGVTHAGHTERRRGCGRCLRRPAFDREFATRCGDARVMIWPPRTEPALEPARFGRKPLISMASIRRALCVPCVSHVLVPVWRAPCDGSRRGIAAGAFGSCADAPTADSDGGDGRSPFSDLVQRAGPIRAGRFIA
jgi:hypothetical protein